MTLVLIGLVGGVITGVSPCVLPVLPVIFLNGGADGNASTETARRRPYVIVLGLVLSFAVFTLAGTLLLSALHLPADTIRWVGLVLLVLLGLGLLIPQVGHLIERPFYRFPQRNLDTQRNAFVLGIALGAVFVPCAGPVLAAITVAGATGHISLRTLGLTLGFAVGTAIPLLGFALAGRGVRARVGAFQRHQGAFRIVSGVVVIALAVALTFNISDVIQRHFPNYTQSVSDKLEKGADSATGGGKSVLLKACQSEASASGHTEFTDCGPAPAFTGISAWFNTPGGAPIAAGSLKGKVVLVDFWAYSCINCQRELPHAEAWSKRYAGDGFEVVGVHTPEYAFEHVPSNVEAGAKRLGLTFPIALDNGYKTWSAFDNDSWPAAYLVDAKGRIRHISIGEGDYGTEESLIRKLLKAAHPGRSLPPVTGLPDTTPTDAGQSPETYLGVERAQYYDGHGQYLTGTRAFTGPGRLPEYAYALAGTWRLGAESIESTTNSQIQLHYRASRVYLDVAGTGTLTVSESGRTRTIKVSGAPDIYTVARHARVADGTVTIALSKGMRAYSFTFG